MNKTGAIVHEFAHIASNWRINDNATAPYYPFCLGLPPKEAWYNADNYRVAVQDILFGKL
jgi:hypothetical protein